MAFLHGPRDVGYAGAFVGDDHTDFVGVDVDEHFAAVGVGDGIDFGFVERHDDTLDDLRVDVELLQRFLDGAGGLAGVDEIAFYDCVFLMHFQLCVMSYEL